MSDKGTRESTLFKRLVWLVVIWSGSVVSLFIVASLLRLLMNAAGMRSH